MARARDSAAELSPWHRRGGLVIPPDSPRAWFKLAVWELWIGMLLCGFVAFGTLLIVTARGTDRDWRGPVVLLRDDGRAAVRTARLQNWWLERGVQCAVRRAAAHRRRMVAVGSLEQRPSPCRSPMIS